MLPARPWVQLGGLRGAVSLCLAMRLSKSVGRRRRVCVRPLRETCCLARVDDHLFVREVPPRMLGAGPHGLAETSARGTEVVALDLLFQYDVVRNSISRRLSCTQQQCGSLELIVESREDGKSGKTPTMRRVKNQD